MKRYNVTVPKKYTKDGTEKTAWNQIGSLVRFDATEGKPEGFVLELNMFPDTKFGVFEAKPKEVPKTEDELFEKSKTQGRVASNTVIPNEINPEDIPF